jgi:hypothetical protein
MLQVFGSAARRCDGISRRSILQAGVLGVTGLFLGDLLRLRDRAARASAPDPDRSRTTRDTACILIFLDGGPTHIDTYDPKPAAPVEYRGQFRPIHTAVPGIEVCEHLPHQARVMDKLTIVRSLAHKANDHVNGPHQMLTGYYGSEVQRTLAPMFPSGGSLTAKLRGPNRPGMPPYVCIPHAESFGNQRPGYYGAAYLGVQYNPFDAGGDPNAPDYKVPDLQLAPGLDARSLEDRRALLQFFSGHRRRLETGGLAEGMDRFDQQAFDLITGQAARAAFDLAREEPRLRERYGRTMIGQSCLLARRLVEAGVTFVTLRYTGWDHHGGVFPGVKALMPPLDCGFAALVEDLHQRGLYDKVLVVLFGEFGRSPKVNGSAGRDHWCEAQFVVLGGGGLKTGQVIGSTNSRGEFPKDRPLGPEDLWATIYHVLGIDTDLEFTNQSGRPIKVLPSNKPIEELVG